MPLKLNGQGWRRPKLSSFASLYSRNLEVGWGGFVQHPAFFTFTGTYLSSISYCRIHYQG
jgi:hypothetical protein